MEEKFDFSPTTVKWDERHKKILMSFLRALETNGIRYVILKNAEGLPDYNYSKDIDILIEPGMYKMTAKLLKTIYKGNGVTYYQVNQFERLRCWYGFNVDTEFAIHIDLLEGFLHKGFELFPFELFYEHAYKNERGIYVLDELYGTLILLLHSTICYHHIKEKYAKRISTAYAKNKVEIQKNLKVLLGERAAGRMILDLENENYKGIAQEGKFYSHESKKKILFQHPLFSLVNFGNFLWEKVERLILDREKYNKFISVHAPDGTGKTTFIKEFCEMLGFYYVCASGDLSRVYHFRPNVLSNLGAVGEKAGVMKQDKDFTKPHRAKPAGTLSSLLRMAYYSLDYLIGTPFILRKNAQFNHITIFDRYIYDMIVDPARTRISLPLFVRKMYAKLVKRPQLSFVLYTDSETIFKRKPELTIEEIERQLCEFRKLSGNFKDSFIVLDASKSPKDIAKEAIKYYMERFAKSL